MKSLFVLFCFLGSMAFAADEAPVSLDMEMIREQIRRGDLNDIFATQPTQFSTGKLVSSIKTSRANVEIYEERGRFRVFGMTEQEVLEINGDPNGSTCSEAHNQGDLSNRWCHASIVKAVKVFLQVQGFSEIIANLLADAVFLPKEYLMDLHPSMSDLAFVEHTVYRSKDKNTRVHATVFWDGATYIVFQKRF